MRKGILLSLLIAGCGEMPCNFNVGGICVQTNGYDVTPAMVSGTVDALSDALRYRGLNKDFSYEFADLGVVAIFIDDHPKFYESGIEYYGRQVGTTVIIKTNKQSKCLRSSYVLGHELLHVVARYTMKVSVWDNYYHSTPWLFYQWADTQPGVSQKETIEFFMEDMTDSMCNILEE